MQLRRYQIDDPGAHHFAPKLPHEKAIFPEQYEAVNLTYRDTE
jgi:hypothetical protein